ncbi:MAG: hypothetical protein KAJ23_00850, partial [Maribacter sp.]|nr:hypothetical protein [Maribacter sp.]
MRNLFVLFCGLLLCHSAQGHSYNYSLANGSIAISDAHNSVLNTRKFEVARNFKKQTTLKSSIGISSPDSGTVWIIPDSAKLEWNTMNIGSSKSIRFFLAKDDMVVQELGTFPNTGKASGIVLAKNIGSG